MSMNDFTKEELNDILACCELYYELAQRLPDKEEESVMRKVKSKIDNYCEQHEADEFENLDYCKHCGVKFR